ncbi:MAG: diaminopimelate epimerase [Gammaproteobacteria bacterium]|nr:diaminopimelate epimerase [Gammaproteobacteria bacterium]MCY4166052.1 diaminopimelate epimerase [Gammaproteobacteria bacterium]MCY4255080.1 diaminopimelate epimerase [Gammaproteobacteria bacterium]MCY4341161.1 diaminopimelate epimerase [Gammaproteobacteria bacterium]
MTLAFTKMQAAGNDFMVVVGRSLPAPERGRVRAWADRRRGVGFDQLLWVEEPEGGSGMVRYRVFNADGGEAEQCGNGALCIAALVAKRRPNGGSIVLESPGGQVEARVMAGNAVRCSLGRPQWHPEKVPFLANGQPPPYRLRAAGGSWEFDALSLGNPHAVLNVPDAAAADVAGVGAALSAHQRFPQGCNVGFAEALDGQSLKLRVYERGAGETPACGTGACAAAVAGIRQGRVRSPVQVHMAGGRLSVEWLGGEAAVWLGGHIDSVFEGSVRL